MRESNLPSEGVITKQKRELGKDSRGTFVRYLGFKMTPAGRTPHRFYLGQDEQEALRRNARLQEHWGIIEGEAQSPEAAIWSSTTLAIAQNISQGEAVCRIAPPTPITDPNDCFSYASLVDAYAKKFRMVAILPDDLEAYQQGKAAAEDRMQEVVRIGRELSMFRTS